VLEIVAGRSFFRVLLYNADLISVRIFFNNLYSYIQLGSNHTSIYSNIMELVNGRSALRKGKSQKLWYTILYQSISSFEFKWSVSVPLHFIS